MKFNKIAAVIAMTMVSAVFAQEAATAVESAQPAVPVTENSAAPAAESTPVAEVAQPAAPVVAAPVAEAAQPAAPAEEAPAANAAQKLSEACKDLTDKVIEVKKTCNELDDNLQSVKKVPFAPKDKIAKAEEKLEQCNEELGKAQKVLEDKACPLVDFVALMSSDANAAKNDSATTATASVAEAAAAPAAEKPAESFSLKGNVQAQVNKSLEDNDNNFSSGWVRANIGAQYKSDNLDGLIMLRIFAPEFGNSIKDGDGKTTAYDKILADLYWINYKWNLGADDKLNLKIGHWKTDWTATQSTHFGTYIDGPLNKRGLWMRDYSHNAVELGWKHGLNYLTAMVATKDNKANTGYVRIEDDLKFSFPLELKFGYRGNLIDAVQYTTYMTHRVAAFASYTIMPNLRIYGEYGCLYTEDQDINKTARNYHAQELGFMNKPGELYTPFYVGLEIPTFGILTNLFAEMEYIKDRNQIDSKKPDADDLAWTVALVKTIGKSKLQFSVFNENKLDDVGMAFRLTTTLK